MQILQYILLFKEQFCKVEVYISVLGWKFRYSKLCWEKEYVHIEYSGPLTRLSSVLCKTLYTYIYLGDTKLHICKKKLATIKLQADIVYTTHLYIYSRKNLSCISDAIHIKVQVFLEGNTSLTISPTFTLIRKPELDI